MNKSNYLKTCCNTPMAKAIYDSSITAGNILGFQYLILKSDSIKSEKRFYT